MKRINRRIEIVSSTVSGLSSMTPRSREAILAVLLKHYAYVRITIVNNLSDLEALVARNPDLVFLGMKFIPKDPVAGFHDVEKIWLADYLEVHDIAYTGSGHMAHELELNKPLAKQRVLDAGLETSAFYVSSTNKPMSQSEYKLRFPVFIKPTNRGGGLGIDTKSVAYNCQELEAKVASISANHGSDSLIEEYLPGREFSVAVLKQEDSDDFLVMPIEKTAPLDKNGLRILSGHIKSADTARDSIVEDENIKAKITDLALNVFHALGARDYGRIDIRLDEAGTPHFLEANLLPSIIRNYGSFPKSCLLNIGLDYEPMLLRIVRLALMRSNSIDEYVPTPVHNLSSLLPALEA